MEEFELSVNEPDAKEVKDHFERNGTVDLKKLLVTKSDEWKQIPIHVAISGSPDSGKSSFINAVRGLKAEDKTGAELNFGKTTIEPIPYSHPDKHTLKFWDLPQLGSPAFSKDLYLKNVKFNKYDFFLIFTKTEFTEDDFWFVEQMQAAQKKFYFVRTHSDLIAQSAFQEHKKSKPMDVQTKSLAAVREPLQRSIKDAKIKTDYVYMITTSDVRKYDFPKLSHKMIVDLPERKWEAMAFTINVLADDVIKQKRRALQKRVWVIAIMSGLEEARHYYGVNCDLDLDKVIDEAQEYRKQFGLDEASIFKFARSIDTTVESLKKASAFKTNYSQLSDGGLLNLYRTLSVYDVVEGITKSFSPILGSLITRSTSFGSTYFVLNKLLDMMETDAIRMMEFVRYRNAETW